MFRKALLLGLLLASLSSPVLAAPRPNADPRTPGGGGGGGVVFYVHGLRYEKIMVRTTYLDPERAVSQVMSKARFQGITASSGWRRLGEIVIRGGTVTAYFQRKK